MRRSYSLSLFVIAIFSLMTFTSCDSEAQESTTYYFIRHAEKDRSDPENRNPMLKAEGEERAKRWASYFEKIDLDAVYSTDYFRTKATAAPTAKSKALKVQIYDPQKLNDSAFVKATLGKKVLVVGHSNTTPAFVNAVIKEKKYESMADTDNSTLFIVSLENEKITSKTEKVN